MNPVLQSHRTILKDVRRRDHLEVVVGVMGVDLVAVVEMRMRKVLGHQDREANVGLDCCCCSATTFCNFRRWRIFQWLVGRRM